MRPVLTPSLIPIELPFMSNMSNSKKHWVQSHTQDNPHFFDVLFYYLLHEHGLVTQAMDYIRPLEISAKQLQDWKHYWNAATQWNFFTLPSEYYSAIELKDWKGSFHGLTSVNYFLRIKKEMMNIAKAADPEPFARVMLNGRIDSFIKSQYPDFVSTRTI